MAIVPAGSGGAINVMASNPTNLIVEVAGYFAPPGAGSLDFYMVTPCRAFDTRKPTGAYGGPQLAGLVQRNFHSAGSVCGVPASARGLSLNATIVPPAPVGYLLLWGGGPLPTATTLNDADASIVSNAAVVAMTAGQLSAWSSNATHLLVDVNGYFQ
jgi:hypothetical protein